MYKQFFTKNSKLTNIHFLQSKLKNLKKFLLRLLNFCFSSSSKKKKKNIQKRTINRREKKSYLTKKKKEKKE